MSLRKYYDHRSGVFLSYYISLPLALCNKRAYAWFPFIEEAQFIYHQLSVVIDNELNLRHIADTIFGFEFHDINVLYNFTMTLWIKSLLCRTGSDHCKCILFYFKLQTTDINWQFIKIVWKYRNKLNVLNQEVVFKKNLCNGICKKIQGSYYDNKKSKVTKIHNRTTHA